MIRPHADPPRTVTSGLPGADDWVWGEAGCIHALRVDLHACAPAQRVEQRKDRVDGVDAVRHLGGEEEEQ